MKQPQIKLGQATYDKLTEHRQEMERKLGRNVTYSEVVEYYQSKITD